MDFVLTVAFLGLYYIRPHEWVAGVAALRPVTLIVAASLVAMFRRNGGLRLRDLMQTPHDYLMMAYLLWIVLSANDLGDAFVDVYPLFAFYLVTAQALSSIQRMLLFLKWWAWLIVLIAGLAVAAESGFDLMDSQSLTFGPMKGRMVLNTSLFDNPNALGHSVVPGLVMLYCLLVWRRQAWSWLSWGAASALGVYCLYRTESKGAMLSLLASLTLGQCFGRKLAAQICIVGLAMTVGFAAIKAMPRMQELDRSKSDPAIQGRVEAFRFGLRSMKTTWFGLGFGRFPSEFGRSHGGHVITSHSSYNRVGAELGYPGLLIFVGVIYAGLRSLHSKRLLTEDEDRVRRCIFVLWVSYIISSWMIAFAFRATFFLIAGTSAAFHRCLLANQNEGKRAHEPSVTVRRAEVVRVGARIGDSGRPWNSFRWLDGAATAGLAWLVIQGWEYAIRNV